MKYFYEFGFSSYEESSYFTMLSDKEYSEKEVKKILLRCIENAIAKEFSKGEDVTVYEIFYSDILRKELEVFGFEVLKYKVRISVWGWNRRDKFWNDDSDGYDKKIYDLICKYNPRPKERKKK